ncbi:hypothetical protein BD94_0167 [Elizabethkingia anophelis NUHP1]|uniref:Uncharacterized protein n=1 Tax=Elizabethkingia anophelis NUHP1 TaxID=1338011 RepID=A0A077E8R0_9FLAO|nr:hypothetical protein BD94_0167 [Elizabethkingia anophelis NUHP1]
MNIKENNLIKIVFIFLKKWFLTQNLDFTYALKPCQKILLLLLIK